MNFPNIRFESLFIDKNNWFYTSVTYGLPSGIYVSKDNAATFSLLSSTADGFNDNISVQSDGNLYYNYNFNIDKSGLYRLNGATGPSKYIYYIETDLPTPYVVAGNNNVISVNSLGGLSYSN
jgi:hypothetical protein